MALALAETDASGKPCERLPLVVLLFLSFLP
jgi:hypothetical protein